MNAWPQVDNPLAQADLLHWCLKFRRTPDSGPLYPHAPDPPPAYPGELLCHYVTAAGAFSPAEYFVRATGFAVSMPTFGEDEWA